MDRELYDRAIRGLPVSAAAYRRNASVNGIPPGAIIKRFGSWAVTSLGVESLTFYYVITMARLNEIDWVRHMSEKRWVIMGDFKRALSAAKREGD